MISPVGSQATAEVLLAASGASSSLIRPSDRFAASCIGIEKLSEWPAKLVRGLNVANMRFIRGDAKL